MLKKLAISLAIGATAVGASAQGVTNIQANPITSAYVQDSRGVITRSQYGLCWRSGSWTPADAVPGCDGDLIPPITNPTAPPIQPTLAAKPQEKAAPLSPKRCDFSFTLGGDQSFGFDKAVLTAAAKKLIDDEVLGKLASCARIDIVLVTGHSDRLGSQQENQKLSDKRAGTVAAYLKSKGITAQIDTLGAGKTQPIKSCDDKLNHQKLIECLAPNRRVVIEARGLGK